jgi:hypothetical protein
LNEIAPPRQLRRSVLFMNIDRSNAERISALLESAIRQLHESIEIAQQALTPSDYETFKRGAGMSLAKISYECLDPIYAKYPDLAPPGVL